MKAAFPTVLVILDGWGVAPPGPGNAMMLARLPFWQSMEKKYPHTLLKASGTAIGLPAKQHGNSEAGHMNIGAGRVVLQDAVRINKTIEDGRFFKNPAFLEAFHHAEQRGGRVHLMGLMTDEESGHSFPSHLWGLMKLSMQFPKIPVYVHLFTDGRDSPKFEAINYLRDVQKHLRPHQKIATVMGRYWGMDRAKRWSRTERSYNALVCGDGKTAGTAEEAILSGYKRGESDEFLEPTLLGSTVRERNAGRIKNNDSVIFFNLRSDRARQMTKPFVQHAFEKMNPGSFRRKHELKNLRFVALTEFGPDLPDILTAFPSTSIRDTLPMALSGMKQLYLAESEKYAHITYFFNGGYPAPVAKEERIIVRSTDIQNIDTQPAMAAAKLTTIALRSVKAKKYDFIAMNFANADMVGHTGNLKAAIKAVRVLDGCLERIAQAVLAAGGQMVITADHGNAEEMLNAKGEIDTEHSSYPVPFFLLRKGLITKLASNGKLADVAPTLLALLDRPQPRTMTGHSLLRP